MIMTPLVDTDQGTLHLKVMGNVKFDLINRTKEADKAVAIWLAVIAGMVAAMVIIGGITRVTGSGLSMVEWRPLLGWLPPLSDEEWQRIFKLYQNSPEYRYINTWMDLSAFKSIFWWEYIHRLWGRLIGVAFFLPFIFFLVTQKIKRRLLSRICFLFFLGGLQGALGWWMVKSGLSSDPSVSQYRLATHLGMAFLILGLLIWTILDLVGTRDVFVSKAIFYHANTVTVLIFLTVIGGALVAAFDHACAPSDAPPVVEHLAPYESVARRVAEFELLRGLPTIMVGEGAYTHVTPSYLTELVERIRRGAHRYDPMKAFLPQWLYRLQTATPTSHNLLGAELAPPIVLMKNRGSSRAKQEQAEQDALEALKAQRSEGGYYGGR